MSVVRVRFSGDAEDIAALIDALRNELAGRFELAGGERAYPNRGAFGVRVYLEARPTPRPNPDRKATRR